MINIASFHLAPVANNLLLVGKLFYDEEMMVGILRIVAR
jgi:hypothetical protein